MTTIYQHTVGQVRRHAARSLYTLSRRWPRLVSHAFRPEGERGAIFVAV